MKNIYALDVREIAGGISYAVYLVNNETDSDVLLNAEGTRLSGPNKGLAKIHMIQWAEEVARVLGPDVPVFA